MQGKMDVRSKQPLEKRKVWSLLIHIAAILVFAYIGLGLILFLMQSKFVYYPTREVTLTPEDIGLSYENVTFISTDGAALTGWYIPSDNAEFTVLFCHGNGGNIMHRLDSIDFFHKMGVNCFIFDYRGYGQSGGKPSEEGTYKDAEGAYRWLTEEKKISGDQIIIFGRSLGGSVAAYLAGSTTAGGLVVESTFTSYVDMGRKFYWYMPVRLFARFKYETIEYIKQVGCPVLVIHSRDDDIVPFELGERLYEAANEPKEFVEILGSHNDGFLVSAETYKAAWHDWLSRLRNRRALTDTGQPS
jgi:fermentation-respiration switch protein FrsA (DUF1100 family)